MSKNKTLNDLSDFLNQNPQQIVFKTPSSKDDFLRRYMKYLRHYEFGLNHAPWNKPNKFQNAENFNYWLEQWVLFYENIYENFNKNQNCMFLIYEKFSDKNFLNELKFFLNIDLSDNFKFNIAYKEISLKYDADLYKKAKDLYYKFNIMYVFYIPYIKPMNKYELSL